jgi:hypothetical protein
MISHAEVESALRSLVVKQVGVLWRRRVWRMDERHWSINGGPSLRLLPAIDRLMRRSRLAIDAPAGQDSSVRVQAVIDGNRR